MRRALPLILVLAILWLPWAALAQEGMPSVTVDGQATLSLKPEVGVITLGATTEALTAAQASRDNAAVMQKVVAALKGRLGPQDRLETAGYWLRPLTKWDNQAKQNIPVGYQAGHEMRLTSRDPLALAALLDAAVAAGANSISGPAWKLADPHAAQRKALAAAFADAQARARVLAQAAGMRLGLALKIKVSGADDPGPMLNRGMAKAMAATPLQPNLVQVRAEVRCVFALLTAAPGGAK
ncbi:MAG: SIMPL domain-containing protein [Proteobacteria bacterium]|nr:SIMPL domain-containing protein [Pseudomonadota bacterium]MBU1453031.1 SIMPL domain-containing protein [Pseudomonadota bacterium]MBU2470673.1 SIMPL domain-containing protein [Pseudomonadota bacterium]MBU2518916.1 SIMPL domain-containing protein [Pseudomonadota bacterium]